MVFSCVFLQNIAINCRKGLGLPPDFLFLVVAGGSFCPVIGLGMVTGMRLGRQSEFLSQALIDYFRNQPVDISPQAAASLIMDELM